MTFVLSDIISNRVFMASDSAETITYSDGSQRIEDVEKSLYFPRLNVGISTWGNARVNNVNINLWLKETLSTYCDDTREVRLSNLTSFLAGQLDREFGLPRLGRGNFEMGLHIGGFESRDRACPPGLCHVFINKNEKQFIAEFTRPKLPEGEIFFLRNGMYEPFAMMWDELRKIEGKYAEIVARSYPGLIQPDNHDQIDLHAEWLGSWVKQLCMILKNVGMPEYVGKTVRVLSFDNNRDVRTYELPEIKKTRLDG